MRPRPSSWSRLRIAEAVALFATVAAFTLTVLTVRGGPAVEVNPGARWLVDVLGWTGAGLAAVTVVGGVFAVYRRVQNTAPRVVIAGAGLVVATAVADLLVSARAVARLDAAVAVGVGELVPIAVVTIAAVVILARGRIVVATRVVGRVIPEDRPVILTGLVLALVVVSAGGGLVATGSEPVAAAGSLFDGWEDGDATDGGWDWGSGDAPTAVTSPVFEGDYAMEYDNQAYNDLIGGSGTSSMSIWVYDRRGTTDEFNIQESSNGGSIMFATIQTDGDFVYDDGTGTIVDTGIDIPSKEWVLVRFKAMGSGSWDFTAYDINGDEIGSETGIPRFESAGEPGSFRVRESGDGTYDNLQVDRDLSDFNFRSKTYSISGAVTDGAGSALDDATLTFDNGSTTTTTTSSDGSYSLTLKEDSYDVTVDRPGFKPLETSISLSSDTTKDFELSGAQQVDYTMQVCYRGPAEFDSGSAGALWTRIPTGQQGGEDALSVQHPEDYDAEITEFGADHNTTNDVTVTDDWYYETQIATRNTAFRFAGHGISAGDTFNQFLISVPFGERAGIESDDGTECDVPGADESETPTPTDGAVTDTATPDTDTPRPSQATATPSPTPIPEAREIDGPTAVGTCTLPAQDGGTKSGLLLEYYDPSQSTETLDYSLQYNGTTYSDEIAFDSPKGYYYGCHGGGPGGLGDGTGGPPALNQTIDELLEPLNTSTDGLQNLTVTYPNGTNETSNLTAASLLNETGLNATQEWQNATLGYLNGTQEVLENISQLPYWNQSGPGWTEPIANVSAGYENGTEETWNQTGFNSTEPLNSVDGINASDPLSAGGGGGGAGLFGSSDDSDDDGIGLIAIPAVAVVGIAAYRRYVGGGGGGGGGSVQLTGGGSG